MISPRDKLEPRGENEPKYDPNNKTDRKIVNFIIITVCILLIIAAGCFLLFYLLLS